MDPVIDYILTNFGVPGIIAVGLYIIIAHSTKQCKEERDAQIDKLEHRITLLEKKTEGFLEGKNANKGR